MESSDEIEGKAASAIDNDIFLMLSLFLDVGEYPSKS